MDKLGALNTERGGRLTVIFILVWLLAVLVTSGFAETIPHAKGQTVYVPAYSHVFSGDRGLPFNVATTLGIRNTALDESITVVSADYYNSHGKLVKRYLEKPMVLAPLASTEIFIKERDEHGGFGASFIVTWQAKSVVTEPVIECVIIGAKSGQGISFVSPGRVIKEERP